MNKLDTIIKKVLSSSDKLNSRLFQRYSNKRLSENIDQIPVLLPEQNNDINVLVRCCRGEIHKAEDSGIMPAPKYFEQIAILSRTKKQYENEIAICEMYIELADEYAAKENLTDAEISTNLMPNCTPFVKRIHDVKIILEANKS